MEDPGAFWGAFDEHARRVLFFARVAVTQPGAAELDVRQLLDAIQPGGETGRQGGGASLDDVHLLLGVLQTDAEAVTRFADPAWPGDRLRQRLVDLAPHGPPVSAMHEIPFSPAAIATVVAAGSRPRRDRQLVVPEHLVWALMADPATPVAALLAEAGVRREAIEAFLDRP
jgi:hypothetical protein